MISDYHGSFETSHCQSALATRRDKPQTISGHALPVFLAADLSVFVPLFASVYDRCVCMAGVRVPVIWHLCSPALMNVARVNLNFRPSSACPICNLGHVTLVWALQLLGNGTQSRGIRWRIKSYGVQPGLEFRLQVKMFPDFEISLGLSVRPWERLLSVSCLRDGVWLNLVKNDKSKGCEWGFSFSIDCQKDLLLRNWFGDN